MCVGNLVHNHKIVVLELPLRGTSSIHCYGPLNKNYRGTDTQF